MGRNALVLLALMAGLLSPAALRTWADAPLEAGYVDADLIRVGISDDAMVAQEYPLTRISANGAFTIKDKLTGLTLLTGQKGDVVTITVDRSGFHLSTLGMAQQPVSPTNTLLSNLPLPGLNVLALPPQLSSAPPIIPNAGPLLVQTENPNDWLKILNITRRKEVPSYRGAFEIVRASSSPNKLSVVNVLSLEDYLKAVVPNELPMRYGWEAVKAQAIAARNYAIRPREKPWKTFDICDSQLCQVYLGAQTETPDSNRAIAETEGLIGLYNGDVILALFSSSHGGYAEAYSNAFSDPITKQYPAPPIPYLAGGPDLPMANASLDLRTEAGARTFWTSPSVRSYDVDSPYYRWQKQWTRPEMEATINQGLLAVSKDSSTKTFITPLFKPGESIGTLKAVRVLERGTSGKAMVVAIEGSRGTWTIKKEFLIRKVFSKGGRMLPSGNVVFTPQLDAQKRLVGMTVNGGGFGHGVGLSQLGASWMSKHGYPFSTIVQHYYKGVSLGSVPLEVGGSRPNQPVITRFGVQRSQGVLWLQEGEAGAITAHNSDPVQLKINGRVLQVAPNGYRSGIPIDDALRVGQLNTLVLFPDAEHPERKVKAWIELYPPNKA